jgi:site-specific DNA-adenine methylase
LKRIGPALSYYGAKWRAAIHYPPPRHSTIIEPFAGGAGYSLLYHTRDVVLVEKYEPVASVWRYLIGGDPERILDLPDLEPGQTVDDLEVSQVERWLVGFWVNKSVDHPCRTPSQWMAEFPDQFWGPRVRGRLAVVSAAVSHWTILEGDYTDAPDIRATWFVDPPYQVAGAHYPCGSSGLDYAELGEWCRGRRGQVMVCENAGAEWLSFEPFRKIRSNQANSGRTHSDEVLWTSGCVEQLHLLG